ncbi:redoxin family protein [Pacificimonas sp. WHA3]|uniref:Redoxin family protein n=1 Tax=Pacificimonas pallii TaxID=2827236 RepID=A0ABS6SEE5_9SPHN|nr:redoxin domain-containing protein [Pacificimonas pallii]MBV7256783.1 redoxin family protein [Pacificimonas pallii]
MKLLFLTAAMIALPMTASTALAAPKIGAPAPAFTAMSAEGTPVSLSDYRGKTVVLEWTNKGCPYVKKHYESSNMQELQATAARDGTVWLTINSSAPGKQGHVDSAGAAAEMAHFDTIQEAYLLDHDGKVGRAYGASATPHMYVIDDEGMLAYMGAIDDRPTSDPADIKGAQNYVASALGALAAGETPSKAATRAYGCSIKYAD